MNCGPGEEEGGFWSTGRFGLAGDFSWGVGIVTLKIERVAPRRGWEGMERECVRRVSVVL